MIHIANGLGFTGTFVSIGFAVAFLMLSLDRFMGDKPIRPVAHLAAIAGIIMFISITTLSWVNEQAPY